MSSGRQPWNQRTSGQANQAFVAEQNDSSNQNPTTDGSFALSPAAFYRVPNYGDPMSAFYVKPPEQDAMYTDQDNQGDSGSASEEELEAGFSEAFRVDTNTSIDRIVTCTNCTETFLLNNKLHKHLVDCPAINPKRDTKSCLAEDPEISVLHVVPTMQLNGANVIESKHSGPCDTSLLRTYRSAVALAGLNTTECYEKVVLDTGCSWSVGDADFLQSIPAVKIHPSKQKITVNGLCTKTPSDTCAMFDVYFPGLTSENTFAKITVTAFLVPNAGVNLLLGMETLAEEDISIHNGQSKATIGSCGSLMILIACRARMKAEPMVSTPVYALRTIVILVHSRVQIPIKVKAKLPNRDLFFEPSHVPKGNASNNKTLIYAHLVNQDFHFVEAINEGALPVQITRHARLGTVAEMPYSQLIRLSDNARELARSSAEREDISDFPTPRMVLHRRSLSRDC
jgi:hypothetical protein